jgi:hypothetical protein
VAHAASTDRGIRAMKRYMVILKISEPAFRR